MNHKKNNKGFTLIELLVVVAIISLLTSVVLASLSDARKKAIDTKILAEYQQLRVALELYYNENGFYPTPNTAGVYCISDSIDDCLLGGLQVDGTLNSVLASAKFDYKPNYALFEINENTSLLAAPAFSYKPSTNYLINEENKGFIYSVADVEQPADIVFARYGSSIGGEVVNATVGVWTLSGGSN